MLAYEHLITKIGFDTADNGACKGWVPNQPPNLHGSNNLLWPPVLARLVLPLRQRPRAELEEWHAALGVVEDRLLGDVIEERSVSQRSSRLREILIIAANVLVPFA